MHMVGAIGSGNGARKLRAQGWIAQQPFSLQCAHLTTFATLLPLNSVDNHLPLSTACYNGAGLRGMPFLQFYKNPSQTFMTLPWTPLCIPL